MPLSFKENAREKRNATLKLIRAGVSTNNIRFSIQQQFGSSISPATITALRNQKEDAGSENASPLSNEIMELKKEIQSLQETKAALLSTTKRLKDEENRLKKGRKKVLFIIDYPNINISWHKKTGFHGSNYQTIQNQIIQQYEKEQIMIFWFSKPESPLPNMEQPYERFFKWDCKKASGGWVDIDAQLVTESIAFIIKNRARIAKVILISGDKDHEPFLMKMKELTIEMEIWGSKETRSPRLNQYATKVMDLF